MRGISAHLVEWRAACFSDPAKRLRFLQKARASPGHGSGKWSLLVIPFGLALTSAAFVQPVWRRSETLAPRRPNFAARSEHPMAQPESTPGRVWLVEGNANFELYSNGLQVQNQFLTGTQSRAYLAYARDSMDAGSAPATHAPTSARTTRRRFLSMMISSWSSGATIAIPLQARHSSGEGRDSRPLDHGSVQPSAIASATTVTVMFAVTSR